MDKDYFKAEGVSGAEFINECSAIALIRSQVDVSAVVDVSAAVDLSTVIAKIDLAECGFGVAREGGKILPKRMIEVIKEAFRGADPDRCYGYLMQLNCALPEGGGYNVSSMRRFLGEAMKEVKSPTPSPAAAAEAPAPAAAAEAAAAVVPAAATEPAPAAAEAPAATPAATRVAAAVSTQGDGRVLSDE
jgi:hypothetical protein